MQSRQGDLTGRGGDAGPVARAAGARASLRQLLLLSAALVAIAPAARAQDWVGTASTDWNADGNWNPATAPAISGSAAVTINSIALNRTVFETGPTFNVFLSSLAIGSGVGANGDLTVNFSASTNPNYNFGASTSLVVGAGGGSGRLAFDLTANDGGIFVQAPLTIGQGLNSFARIEVLGPGTTVEQQGSFGHVRGVAFSSASPGDLLLGSQEGTAEVVADGAAIRFHAPPGGNLVFGSGANSRGSMSVLNGGKGALGFPFGFGTSNAQVIFGDAGGTGDATVSGAGPDGTPSRLILSGGATTFGSGTGSHGTLNVLSGGKATSMPSQPASDPQLGANGGTGVATVSGPGSVWNIIGETQVPTTSGPPLVGEVGNLHVGGPGGTGVLTLTDGGHVALGQGAITLNTGTPTEPGQQYYTLTDFTPGLGTVFVAEQPGSTGTVNFGAPAGSSPAAPGTLDAAAVQFGDGDGRIVFNHTAPDFTYAIPTSGPGTVQTLAGTTTLTTTGAMTYTGPTLVDGGILRAGDVDVLSQGSQHSVGPAGQLDLAGFNQTVPGMTNAGLITMNPAPGAVPGTTLTVAGDYVGQGGVIAMNTVLAGDGAASDRLVINGGTATGDTRLHFTNAGGAGAQIVADGIRVVEATNGGTTAAGAFRLDTRVAAGAYEYQLVRGGSTNANDWFLRNTRIETDPGTVPADPGSPAPPVREVPNYRPEVPLYTAMPGIAHRLGFAMIGSMHERLGDVFPTARSVPAPAPAEPVVAPLPAAPPPTRWCKDPAWNFRCPVTPAQESVYRDAAAAAAVPATAAPRVDAGIVYAGRAAWARVFGVTGDHRPGSFLDGRGPSYDYTIAGFQAGTELIRREELGGTRDQIGFYAGYAQARADVDHAFGGRAGSITMDGYSLGAYWTHFGAQGWYVDTVAQVTRFDGSARSAFGERLSTDGWGITLSLEGGYPIALGDSGWVIEPQAQVIYQRVSLDDGADRFGRVDFADSNAVLGRIGARVMRSFTLGAGDAGATPAAAAPRRLSVWGRANLWHAFGDDPETSFSASDGSNPQRFSTSLGGTWAQVGLGVSSQVTETVGLYASGDYSFSVDSRSSTAWGGRIGVRVTW